MKTASARKPKAPPPAPATNVRDYAVVIGIKHYTDLTALEGPVCDATNFCNWLTDPAGGSVPRENVFLIPSDDADKTNPKPLQSEIDDALEKIELLGAAPDPATGQPKGYRRLYFYFSGHGIGVTWDENGLCLPRWSQKRRNYALSSSEYFDYFVSSDLFEEVLFFLDCCRNRVLGARPFPPALGWARSGGGKTRRSMSLQATNFENVAREALVADGSGMSVTGYFTRALLEGLRGAAADAQGNITMASLTGFVQVRTGQLAGGSQAQSARLGIGEIDGDFIIRPGLGPPTTELHIRFPKAGRYRIEGQGLSVLKEGPVAAGATWTVPGLTRNIYPLLNLAAPDQPDYIRIDGTQKKLNHECTC